MKLMGHKINVKVVVIAAVIVAAYIGLFTWAFGSMERSFYRERTEKTYMLMGKIAQNIETAVQGEWTTLHQFINVFNNHKHDSDTLAGTLEELGRIQDTFSADVVRVALVDDNAVCYRIDGETHKWNKQELLSTGQDECYISDSEGWATDEAVPHLFFISPLGENLTVEGITFTHMMFSVEMSAFDKYFDTSEFGESSVCFIIRNTGGQIYRQEKANPISGVLNVVSALSRADFNYGASIEQMKDEIHEGMGNCINLTYEGVSYDVAYEPLSINEWMALLMVPSEGSLSGTRSFMNSIISTTGILAAATLILIVAVLITVSRRVNAQLQSLVEAEKSANDAKTKFLSSMSHDIRTPMNAIIGMTNLARKHMDDTEYVKNCLTKVSISSHHLLTLINDVLDISKVESGKMSLHPGHFSLAQSIAYLVNVVMPQIHEKEQTFEIVIRDLSREEVYADQLRLNQVLINLLSNAMKYTDVGGDIKVELRGELPEDHPGYLRFVYKVQDNGIGMSEEFQKNMYNSFERENTAPQSSIQGSGLGLAICKQMVTLMGGTIDCVSEVGVGTTFTVTLDLELAEHKEPESLPKLHILLADGCEELLSPAAGAMESLGMEVEYASAAEAVAEKLEVHDKYDVVIADWKMAEAIQPLAKAKEIPLLVSDYDTEGMEDFVRKIGAKGVVGKPYFKSGIYHDLSNFLGLNEDMFNEDNDIEDLAGMRILVAEDNDFNWEIASEILRMSQVETVRAANGQECVELMMKAEEGEYDLILMDIQMPVMNGYETTATLRASKKEYLRTIPIIAMTADAFAEDIQRCMDVGMNGHIAKPVEISKLMEAIQKNRGGCYDAPGKP